MSQFRCQESGKAELLAALIHVRNVLNAKGGSTEMERVKATLQADVAIARAKGVTP